MEADAGNTWCFPQFSLLPSELRLVIWKMAFGDVDPAVTVCRFSENHKAEVSTIHRHAAGEEPGLPHIALTCREAQGEWRRLTRCCKFSYRFCDRVYLPRSVFIVPALAIVESRLGGLVRLIEHIAFDVTNCPDVLSVFESLARFPHL